MRRHDGFRFYLSSTATTGEREVYPIWGGDNGRTRKRADGEYYFVSEIAGNLTFTRGQGYEEIVEEQPLTAVFTLRIQQQTDTGWADYETCEFTRLDGVVNEDLGTIEITPDTLSDTKDLDDVLEVDYNVPALGIEKETIRYERYPVLQVYALETTEVLNVQPGTYWTKNVERFSSSADVTTLTDTFGFSDAANIAYIPPVAGAVIDVSGYYDSNGYRLDGAYRFRVLAVGAADTFIIIRESDQLIVYRTTAPIADAVTLTNYVTQPIVLGSLVDNTEVAYHRIRAFSRVLTYGDTFAGSPTTAVTDGDQFAAGMQLTKVATFTADDITIRVDTATVDQGLGRFPTDTKGDHAGAYIGRPTSDQIAAPIYFAGWGGAAFWFLPTTAEIQTLLDEAEEIEIGEGFPLDGVLSAILTESETDLTFLADTDHSELLFGSTDPLTAVAPLRYFITPISNVLVLNFTEAATKGELRLADLFDFLKFTLNAYRYDDGTKLIIEHLSYYENGRSYTGEASVGFDATATKEQRTGRAWSYFANTYQFNKDGLADKIVTDWPTDVSDAFAGLPITVTTPYVNRGQTDRREITKFHVDLGLALAQPSAFPTKGFFVFACEQDGDVWRVKRVAVPSFGTVQNGGLAVPYLYDNYHRHGLPAADVVLNGAAITAESTRKIKRQEITIPSGYTSDLLALVQTGLGRGEIVEAQENWENRVTTLTLEYGND